MNVAIIVAAGSGTRMRDADPVPKQFRELAGAPLVVHTLRRFEQSREINETVVAVPAGRRESFLADRERHGLSKLTGVVAGGRTRSESVRLALDALDAARTEVVAVHDGARPFVTPGEIDRVVRLARAHGAAILAAEATDTIKEIEEDHILRTLPRPRLRRALTPQAFRFELLREAYDAAGADDQLDATDDSSLVERLGISVRILEGDPRNIKITRPEDWALAEEMMKDGRWQMMDGSKVQPNAC